MMRGRTQLSFVCGSSSPSSFETASFSSGSQPRARAKSRVQSPTIPATIPFSQIRETLARGDHSRMCTERSSSGAFVSVNGCHCQHETAGQLIMMYCPGRMRRVFSFLICSSMTLLGWWMTLLMKVRWRERNSRSKRSEM